MTSSWMLKQRKLHADRWSISNFGDPNNALGGWEDHYMIPGGTKECHPDYVAHPIGGPYGFMICARKKFGNNEDMSIGSSVCSFQPSDQNGYKRYSSNLYDTRQKTPTQLYNPDSYHDRRIPYEEYLHANDYLSRPLAYDGTGTRPIHTPPSTQGQKYSEYGFSYTTSIAPAKYDVRRLHQAFPIWKAEQEFTGVIPPAQLREYERTAPSVTMGVL